MTDIENYVINQISEGLSVSFPEADVLGEYVDAPERFPCVCLELSDRETYIRSLDGDLQPHHETVYFTVNVYSNSLAGKKAEAKKLMALTDEIMTGMKFTRTMCSPTPNIDRSIYRISARYKAVHGNAKSVDGTDVVQMYRE